MSDREPNGLATRAYDNGQRDWHLKPSVMIAIVTMVLGLGMSVLGGGIWVGGIATRVETLEERSRERNAIISSVARIEAQVTSINERMGRLETRLDGRPAVP